MNGWHPDLGGIWHISVNILILNTNLCQHKFIQAPDLPSKLPVRYFWCPDDIDDADSLPTWCSGWSKLKRGRCISKACLPDLAWHRCGSTREALSEDAAAAASRYAEVERGRKSWKGGRVLSPERAWRLFSSSPLTWLMQLQHTLGELISFKAGWVSKVNDLIIFPASLLRSQLSGSGKWGCGPLWRLRHVSMCTSVCACACVCSHICASVCLYICI